MPPDIGLDRQDNEERMEAARNRAGQVSLLYSTHAYQEDRRSSSSLSAP
jgi:hypothetical protein